MLKEGMNVATRPAVGEAAKSQFLVFPVIDTLTLGLYSMVTPGSGTYTYEREKMAVETTEVKIN